jgi:hypothetical protein
LRRISIHWITILSNTTGAVPQAVVQTLCEYKNLRFLDAGCDKTKPRTNEDGIVLDLKALLAKCHKMSHIKSCACPVIPFLVNCPILLGLGGFTYIEPCALESYCAACLYCSASSEISYLLSLEPKIKERVSLRLPLNECKHMLSRFIALHSSQLKSIPTKPMG